jgi:Domain of unknown function (DUF4288)
MFWYAANAIMYIKFDDGNQDKYPVFENIILIEANSDKEAVEKAKTIAKEEEIQSNKDFTWEKRPASLVFAGIRKLISFNNPEEAPSHGTEITYSQLEVKTKEDLLKLARGEPVMVMYEE